MALRVVWRVPRVGIELTTCRVYSHMLGLDNKFEVINTIYLFIIKYKMMIHVSLHTMGASLFC